MANRYKGDVDIDMLGKTRTLRPTFGALAIAGFECLARLTPSKTDDAIVSVFYKIFSVLGVNVPDNPGKADE